MAALVAALTSASVLAQSPPPVSFPTKVELVTVDAVVLDAEGRPVRGLGREDFVVEEDGQPREIVSLEPFVWEPAPVSVRPSVVASNETARAAAGRAFALVIDDAGMALQDVVQARTAVEAFLAGSLRDGDEVTLATTSGDAWWTAVLPEGREDLRAILARLKGRRFDAAGALDFLSDYEAHVIVSREASWAKQAGTMIDRVTRRWTATGACPSTGSGTIEEACRALIRGRAGAVDAARGQATGASLATVRRAAASLALLRGRKSLLFFSRGFLDDSSGEGRDVAAAARESNTAVYFVDVRGLVAIAGLGSAADSGPAPDARDLGSMAFEERVLESAGAVTLADETGGFSIRNTNDLAAGADRVAAEARAFYMLGFLPAPGPAERWRKLRVSVRREGLTVRARRGYRLGVAEANRAEERPRRGAAVPAVIGRALDSAHQEAGIPLRAMAYVFEPRGKDTNRVLLAAEFDAARLHSHGATERVAHVDVSVSATQRDTGQSWAANQRLEVRLDDGSAPSWRGWAREVDLPSGIMQARVVVRDATAGALGSVTQRFEVPPATALRLTTPIVTNRLDPASSRERPRPALAVHRVFPPEGQLYCQFEVLGASRRGRGAPRVSAGLELRAADGRVLRKAAPTPIAPDPDARLVRVVGIGLSDLPEGDYELLLDVQDEIGGRRIEQREPFTLARAQPSVPSS